MNGKRTKVNSGMRGRRLKLGTLHGKGLPITMIAGIVVLRFSAVSTLLLAAIGLIRELLCLILLIWLRPADRRSGEPRRFSTGEA